ncbi:Gfo/Idh/MocA family protein [Virgibacillus senegalensis]|uniref:Gfo/Idh/MocA family protein n=1 Tax=Virgibacillus senegalensis TaxID=1499679 RepID=UPI00069D53CB|nr:Gfo/Idh/MocA family oxidoreductase [Virgibacillus senegalensis]
MKNLKIGVIGTGRFGRLHLEVFSHIDNCQVLGIADIDKENLKATQKKFRVERTYSDAMKLIQDKDIDVVDIVSDESTHGTFAIEAIKNGKHVFIEKPIATSFDEAVKIEELASLHNVQVMIGNISRFSTPYFSIKEAIENGALGDLAMIRAKRNFSKSWFDHFGKRVHPVYESGIHDIDLILWYANSPCEEVYAVENNISGYKYPDLFSAILKFGNGLVASLDSAWLYPKGGPQNLVETLELEGTIDADIEIIGKKGTANYKLNHSGYSIWTEKDVKHPELTLWTTEHDGIGGAIRSELQHFIFQIEKGEESLVAPVHDSVEAMKIADAIVQAAAKNKPIKL